MSLRSLFERLHNSGSPAYQDLVQLKETLDGECWQVSEGIASPSRSEDYTSDLIKRIAVYLSGPLNQVEDSLSSRYRILQLRTLIAALALLHHLGVEELHAEPYSRLRLNISDRFSDIAHGRRRSQSLAIERNRRVTSLYLVRLAAQYFSLFKRSLPRPEALVAPVLGLILTGASIASGQYNNLQNVFVYFDQIIAEIPTPQRQQWKITLPGIQEIVRNSISALERHDPEDNAEVLLEASALLREALETRFHDTPVSKSRWDRARTVFHRTPQMNRGFVMLGLLDCAIQLSSQSGPDTIPSELQRTVQRLAFESPDWNTRWASIEFFLSFGPSRQRQRFRIQNEASLCPPTVTARIVDELEVVYEALEADEPSLGQRGDSTSSSSEVSHSTPVSSTSITRQSTLSNDNKEPPIEPAIPPRSSRTFHLQIGKSYTNAGISEDSRLLYYYNHKRIIMYSTLTALESTTRGVKHPLKDVFDYSERPGHTIHRVALSRTWMVICTDQDLAVLQIRNHTVDKATAVRRPCAGWAPRGLAIQEFEDSLKIVLGQCRQGRMSLEGRMLLFTVRQTIDDRPSICEPLVYNMDGGDHPKDVDFSQNGRLILCRTQLRNTVLVWKLPSHPSANERSISISKSGYTPETGIQGVTSVSTYTSQSEKQYLLCTTAASSERCRNEGEWPYCSPITFPPGHVAGASVHNLESLRNRPSLVSGAVSSVLNVFAVLETNGKISLIGLQAHPQGGIYDGDQEPETVEFSLNDQRTEYQICPSALRFDQSGTRLYAVGPDGKMVIVDFVDRNDLPVQPSSATSDSRKSLFPPWKRGKV